MPFFFIELSISILVGVSHHLLKFSIIQRLVSLLGNTLQVLEGDEASGIIVEQPECFQHILFRVLVQDLMCHHLQKFVKTNLSTAIIIHLCDHFLDLPWLGLASKRLHSNGQLLEIDTATSIDVKEVKRLLDFLFFFIIELCLLL